MRLIIDGKIAREDLVLFAKFLRELWRHREDRLFVYIEHGTEKMTSEECMALFREIFTGNDKDWKENVMTDEIRKEFQERMKK